MSSRSRTATSVQRTHWFCSTCSISVTKAMTVTFLPVVSALSARSSFSSVAANSSRICFSVMSPIHGISDKIERLMNYDVPSLQVDKYGLGTVLSFKRTFSCACHARMDFIQPSRTAGATPLETCLWFSTCASNLPCAIRYLFTRRVPMAG